MTAQEIRTASTTVYFDVDVHFGSLAALFTNISSMSASEGNRTFRVPILGAPGIMSAFPESGRSDHQKLSEIRVRFRPKDEPKCKYSKTLVQFVRTRP